MPACAHAPEPSFQVYTRLQSLSFMPVGGIPPSATVSESLTKSTLSTTEAPATGYRHAALMYAGEDQLVARTVPFLRAGIAGGEPALVVVGRKKIDRLRGALGGDARQVQFADMDDVGANPARIIPAWQDFVSANPGRRLRGIGEPIYPERSPAELVECQHHERLLNLALDDSQLHLVCPYDTDALGAEVIEEAHHSHPFVSEGGKDRASVSYTREKAAGLMATALPEPRVWPHVIAFFGEDFAAMREFVARQAEDADMSLARRDDLVLAVHEIATNSVRHGGGAGTLRVWHEPGELICEVRDAGHIDDPLVDRRRPGGRPGGYGLWLANRLCDLVQLRTGPAGSVVRLHMRVD